MVIDRGRPDMTLRFTMDNENSGNPFVCFQQLATYFQSRPAICDSPRGNPKGCKKVAGGRSPRRPPEKSLVMTAPRRGARHRHSLRILIFNLQGYSHCVGLAPLRGAILFIIRSGGLRGLRPPATFLATLRVADKKVSIPSLPLRVLTPSPFTILPLRGIIPASEV